MAISKSPSAATGTGLVSFGFVLSYQQLSKSFYHMFIFDAKQFWEASKDPIFTMFSSGPRPMAMFVIVHLSNEPWFKEVLIIGLKSYLALENAWDFMGKAQAGVAISINMTIWNTLNILLQ